MNIYVYWNRNNKDCTKIFHFMSPNDENSVIGDMETNNKIKINRVYKPFADCTDFTNDVQESELVIFLTHGTADEILKYCNDPKKEFGDYILVNKDNADILGNKIVLAFCCSSAKTLGKYCVENEPKCIAYVGFENDIVYDNGRAEKSRHIIYESYKLAFMKSIKYAINDKCTAKEYRIKLLQLMRKEAAKAILKSNNQTLHNMYMGTISGLVALGKTDEVIFK